MLKSPPLHEDWDVNLRRPHPVRLIMSNTLELEQHIMLEENDFLNMFVKQAEA